MSFTGAHWISDEVIAERERQLDELDAAQLILESVAGPVTFELGSFAGSHRATFHANHAVLAAVTVNGERITGTGDTHLDAVEDLSETLRIRTRRMIREELSRDDLVTHIAYCHEAVGHCSQAGDAVNAAYWQIGAEQAENQLARMDAVIARFSGWAECFGCEIAEVAL